MTNETRTADDIERDIAEDRAEMSGTINDLQRKFSVEGIVSDLGAMFRDQGGDLGRSITATVGRNPAAVALVGVGLAWLVLGQGRGPAVAGGRYSRDAAYGGNWGRPLAAGRGQTALRESENSWFDDGGMVYSQKPRHDPNAPTESATGIMGSLRNGADAVVGAVSGAAGAVRDAAMDLTDKLSSGTDGLSDEAKARVLAARRAAHEARVASQDALRQGRRVASNLFEDQPLVMGALAIAVGAAVGGLLPHSQIEDDTLGANSDRLFADAQKVFREERDKAMAVIKAAASEARDALKDTGADLAELVPDGKTGGQVIVDHIANAAARVSNTAKGEAARQGLLGDRQS